MSGVECLTGYSAGCGGLGAYSHYGVGSGHWLADVGGRAVIYSVVNHVMRGLSLPEVLAIGAVVVLGLVVFNRRRGGF